MRTFPFFAGLLGLGLLGSSAMGQFVEPPVAVDVNPDPTIVEIFLEASDTTKQYLPGATTAVSAYNGTVPGPTIEANVGDTLIVHFTNNLSISTTVHWHGVETPAQMDGSHIAQKPIPPGGTFDYEFDLLTASLFWYHPHVRTHEKVESGLYGALLVRDPVGEAGLGLPANERILMVDDILLDAGNQIETHDPADPLEKIEQTLNGREGNHLMINGKIGAVLPVTNGVPERWRIVNVANTKFFRLSWETPDGGNVQQVYRIGGDGGLLEAPLLKDPIDIIIVPPVQGPGSDGNNGGADHFSNADPELGIFVTPGERADVVFTPDGFDGGTIALRSHDWNRGAHAVIPNPDMSGTFVLGDDVTDGNGAAVDILRMLVSGPPATPYIPPANLRTITPIDPNEVVGTLNIIMGHQLPPLPASGDVKLFVQMVNGMPKPMPLMTPLEAYDVEIGSTYLWEVKNLTHMDHPFHTHGWTFQPFEIEYTHVSDPLQNHVDPIPYIENKDTFRVPGRTDPMPFSSNTTLRAYATFTDAGRVGEVTAEGLYPEDDTSGGWLAHCHILEHSAHGMMTFFETREPDALYHLLGNGLAGAAGIPVLRIGGDLTAGSPATLDVSNAAPSAFGGVFIGTSLAPQPLFGGTLIPSINVLRLFGTNASGELSLGTSWPAGLPPGTEFFWQYWVEDVGAPEGYAATNAVKTITP